MHNKKKLNLKLLLKSLELKKPKCKLNLIKPILKLINVQLLKKMLLKRKNLLKEILQLLVPWLNKLKLLLKEFKNLISKLLNRGLIPLEVCLNVFLLVCIYSQDFSPKLLILIKTKNPKMFLGKQP